MNNRDLIRNAFEKISPSESLTERTINMERKKSDFKIRPAKKTAWIIAAAIALMLSVTAVAATLDFDEIFGNSYLRAENDETANLLVADIINSEAYSDNKDYIVSLKGVTGSDNNFTAVVEIIRADGKPVTDFMKSIGDKDLLVTIYDNCKINNTMSHCEHRFDSMITDNGNIRILLTCTSDNNETFSGKEIEISGKDFYVFQQLIENRMEVSHYQLADNEYEELIEAYPSLTDDAILELDWGIKFTYIPTESTNTRIYNDFNEKVTLYRGIGIFDDNETEMKINTLRVSSSVLVMDYKCTGHGTYGISTYYHNYDDNEFVLVKKDGTEIMLELSSSSYGGSDKINTAVFTYSKERYSGENLVINLDEIEALRINDKIYKLS